MLRYPAHVLEASRQKDEIRWNQALFWLPLFVVTMVYMSRADLAYAASGGQEIEGLPVGASTSRQISFLILGGMGSLLLFGTSWRRVVPVWPVLLPTAALVAYGYASVFWSDDPLTTVKRMIVMSCILLAGFGLGKIWSYRQFNWAMLFLLSTFLITGTLAELHYRSFVSSGADYRFSGVFHPNGQAFICGMLTLASLSLYFTDGRKKRFLLIAAIAVVSILLTKSRTGLAATGVASIVLAWPYLPRRHVVVTGLVVTWLAAVVLTYVGATGKTLDVINVARMGRDSEAADPTKLTGRLPLWEKELDAFQEQPIFGFGYGAFFTHGRLIEFERSNGWMPGHSHSAYVESLVNLGLVGSMLLLLIAVVAFLRSRRLSVFPSSISARFIVGLFIFAFITGITEITFIATGHECLTIVTCVGLMAFAPVEAAGVRQRQMVRKRIRQLPACTSCSILSETVVAVHPQPVSSERA